MDSQRYKKILGLEEFQPKQKYVCFLPFIGEFGWYIQCFVKRIHGYNHFNKIVCTKPGHEALFPTASEFYYHWQDVNDNVKAGILSYNDQEELLKQNIIEHYQTDDIFFVLPDEASWEEKTSLSHHVFIPQAKTNNNLEVDVVLAPRKRFVDSHRNWKQENWQYVANLLNDGNIKMGICGAKDSSFELEHILHRSYDYIDVDSDIEMMSKAKLVIVQESGLQYLSFLCKRPTMCIDNYMKDLGSEEHRPKDIFFKDARHVWKNPHRLVDEIFEYLGHPLF